MIKFNNSFFLIFLVIIVLIPISIKIFLSFTSKLLIHTTQNVNTIERYNITVSNPPYFPIGKLLTMWNPDDTRIHYWLQSLAHPDKNKHVERFNFLNVYFMIFIW